MVVADVISIWVAPIAALVVGGLVVAVITAVFSQRRDRDAEKRQALQKANDEKDAAEKSKDQLVDSMKVQLDEVHEALLGSEGHGFTPATPGLVKTVEKINSAVFDPGGLVERMNHVESWQKAHP